MSASSVTGTGPGASDKVTIKDLAISANGPQILIAGVVNVSTIPMSPPSELNDVIFPEPLPGSHEDYCVVITSINGGYAYISENHEEDGFFTGFSVVVESEEDCDVNYLVVKKGVKRI